MVNLRHLGRALRARLTYANTISTLALFSVLGGGAYAATTLAPDSVGRRELKPGAVTPSRLADASVGTPKLAPRAVNFDRLSSAVRAQVLRKGRDGAPGPAGAAGPAGAQGPAGPAAARVHYSAAASTDAGFTTVLDMGGVQIAARCDRTGSDVGYETRFLSSEDATAIVGVTVDDGSDINDPNSSNGTEAQNVQFNLQGGTPQVLPGFTVSSGYGRAISHMILATPSRTITLQGSFVADATSGRCSVEGSAFSAG